MQTNLLFIFNMSHILLTKTPLSWSELLRNIRFLLIFQVVTLVDTFSHSSELQFNSWPVLLCKLITTGSHQDATICHWSGHEASECQMIGFSTYISSKFNRLYLYACTLGCFWKDTLKKNKKPNPVRNWGGPKENISRRRGWSDKSRRSPKALEVWKKIDP